MLLKSVQIIILGSTGSIGQNTIRVIRHLNDLYQQGLLKRNFQVAGLVANSNWKLLLEQIKLVKPSMVGLMNQKALDILSPYLKNTPVKLCRDNETIHQMITNPAVDIVLVAISGASALSFTLTALKAGKTLALANKEVLVMAGDIITDYARRNGTEIRPVDSEHSAIFQAMHCGKPSEVKRIFLTASGGPFYHYTKSQLKKVTLKQSLQHPTWQMGTKITIDSATLMNKTLEIIEAHWLFNLSAKQINVLIHPQSIVHSLVEFRDGSIIAQMSKPDMKIPIQFALTYPERLLKSPSTPLNKGGIKGGISLIKEEQKKEFPLLSEEMSLTFIEPDKRRFPALELGYEVIRRGGTAGAVLNAADEETVKLFINQQIKFTDIIPLVRKVLFRHKVVKNPKLKDILEADQWARDKIL